MKRNISLYDLATHSLANLDLGFSGKNGINLVRACLLVSDPQNEIAALAHLVKAGVQITDADLQFACNVFPNKGKAELLQSLRRGEELKSALPISIPLGVASANSRF